MKLEHIIYGVEYDGHHGYAEQLTTLLNKIKAMDENHCKKIPNGDLHSEGACTICDVIRAAGFGDSR